MDWGDAAGWAAFAISGGALWVSFRAQRDGRRSANAAEESVREARRSGDAAVRSAVAAELTLADQQRAAEVQRVAEANRPRPVLSIEHSRKAVWQLINSGTAAAEHIRCDELPEAVVRGWEDDLSLPPGEVHEFMMAGSMGSPIPAVLRLVWDGQDEPVPLRVPPRIG
ncbi:hypothetical protein [Streptomyces sp. NBC_01618]|uniref:hypothetical protein n=1 Tax=Streptomyces sp. NBC_01618 TaxID=2975900 RepID=UPI00386BA985|nr:hypothetical protein OH735_28755 [Streptomyces sp. NBC_01618]